MFLSEVEAHREWHPGLCVARGSRHHQQQQPERRNFKPIANELPRKQWMHFSPETLETHLLVRFCMPDSAALYTANIKNHRSLMISESLLFSLPLARVYAILAGQLLVTAGSIYMFGTNDWASQLIRKPGKLGAAVPAVSLLLSTVSWFVMAEWPTARRASPLKWQLLTLFTLGESIAAGFLTSFFKFPSVVTAMMATVVAVVSIAVYTITQPDSRYDLSQWGAGLTSAGLIFLFLGLIQLLEVCGVLPKGFLPITEKAYCFFGATLFTIYLAHHTRMVVAGKHTKYQMNEKDYVFGALTLYNDIISLFTYLLRILGEDRE